jgi:hypothetical protein
MGHFFVVKYLKFDILFKRKILILLMKIKNGVNVER